MRTAVVFDRTEVVPYLVLIELLIDIEVSVIEILRGRYIFSAGKKNRDEKTRNREKTVREKSDTVRTKARCTFAAINLSTKRRHGAGRNGN